MQTLFVRLERDGLGRLHIALPLTAEVDATLSPLLRTTHPNPKGDYVSLRGGTIHALSRVRLLGLVCALARLRLRSILPLEYLFTMSRASYRRPSPTFSNFHPPVD